jgi:hypothetical protein
VEHQSRSAQACRLALLVALGLAAVGSITSASTASADAQVAAIRAVGEQWRALYEAGRYAEIPELCTEDCVVIPRGRSASSTRVRW